MFALLLVAGVLAFGLVQSDFFGAWSERGGVVNGSATTTVSYALNGDATIVDSTTAVGKKYYLIASTTSDDRSCYQLADERAAILLQCVTGGLTPIDPKSTVPGVMVIPALSIGSEMPPVVIGSANVNVSRIELKVGPATQRIVPVAWPEIGRSVFIAPVEIGLANNLFQDSFVAVAYDAAGKCLAAEKALPVSELTLKTTKDCPK